MKLTYIYPGTFCPPTIGHYQSVTQAAKLFPKIIIICSINPSRKKKLFKPDKCKALWQTYDLPKNVEVKTLSEFLKTRPDFSKVMMIRGIRDKDDLKEENKIVTLNYKEYSIDKYVYLLSKKEFKHISASKARIAAANLELEKLSEHVSPLVISTLLEKKLDIKNLFMVVGKPRAGKSTFLKILNKKNPKNIHINTDKFNQKLKPLLKQKFGKQNLIAIAINNKGKLKAAIEKPWLKLLKAELKKVPPKSNVFIEIPYGLQSDKQMFRFVGGKIIYIGCENKKSNIKRLKNSGRDKLIPFIDQIPNKKETIKIVKKYKLALICIDSNGLLNNLEKKAINFNQIIKQSFVKPTKIC